MKHHPHIYKIKRKEKKTSKDPRIAFLDKVILVLATVAPFANLPQIYKIFSLQSATGVSVLTFIIFAIFDIPWIIYGYVHKEKPVLITFSLWFITNVIVIIGAFIYG